MKKHPKQLEMKNLFITDRALQTASHDEFGHVDYASLLENLVLNQPTPFNIGIFGKWGVGKSTIFNLLKEKLSSNPRSNKFKFLEVKVWKYEEDSLRKKFILNIAKDLGLPLDDLYKEIYHEQEFETALLNIRDIWNTVFNKKSIALISLITSFTLLIIFYILAVIGVGQPTFGELFKTIEKLLIIPFFLSIFGWIWKIIKTAKVKLKIGKYDSNEQFEDKFIELVKADKTTKIIFIDDLDRCSKEKVVKTLETIKTFLDVEGCIFIIACDDEIVKEAINRVNEMYSNQNLNESEEYLEKFFQYTVRIPPFMTPDIKEYVWSLLERNKSDLLKLERNTLEDLIFILINKNIQSPRNAITAINEFASSYVLAKKREQNEGSRLHENLITNNLPVLAILTSFRLHHPQFYEALLQNNDLIFWLISIQCGNIDLPPNAQEVCAEYFAEIKEIDEAQEKQVDWKTPRNDEVAKLLDYIDSVKDFINLRDISPFLYLGIDHTSYFVGDEFLQEFNESLKYGYEKKVESILSQAAEDKKQYLFDHLNNWIQDKLQGTERRKALQILSKNFDKCPNSKLHETSRVFFNRFYDRNMTYEEYKKYAPNGIFVCARHLDETQRKGLLKQCFDFLSGEDIDHDKLILDEIFANAGIINDEEIIAKVCVFIDKRALKEDETEGQEEESIHPRVLDIDYVKNKILEFEAKPELLQKFFSGTVVEEMADHLAEVDKSSDDTDDSKEQYHEAKKVFELLKEHVLQAFPDRLCDCYRKLIKTSKYYSVILDNIDQQRAEIPSSEVNGLAVSLSSEIPNYDDIKNIELTLDLLHYWIGQFPELTQQTLMIELSGELVELSERDNEDIFKLGLSFYSKLRDHLPDEDNEKIQAKYISLIQPMQALSRSVAIKKCLMEDKKALSNSNRQELLSKLSSDLNTLEGIRNNDCYEFWFDVFKGIIEQLQKGDLDVFIKPSNNQNLLSLNFPNATNDDRSRFLSFLTNEFETQDGETMSNIRGIKKLSQEKQEEFCNLFFQFLNNPTKENAKYSINTIYSVLDELIDNALIGSNISLFIDQFELELEPNTCLQNVEIVLFYKEELTDSQLDKTFSSFAMCADQDPNSSIEILLQNWDEFGAEDTIALIKTLANTQVFSQNKYQEKTIDKLVEEFEGFQDKEVIDYLNELEAHLKDKEMERTFFAEILFHLSNRLSNSVTDELRSLKVDEIKKESDIDLCRNKFSAIIAFKKVDYDRDKQVNALFFSLLYDKRSKKELAIDVFQFYYEDRHPYGKKGELTECLKNLMKELDGRHKETIRELARKYDLKIKRKFFDGFFGTKEEDFID